MNTNYFPIYSSNKVYISIIELVAFGEGRKMSHDILKKSRSVSLTLKFGVKSLYHLLEMFKICMKLTGCWLRDKHHGSQGQIIALVQVKSVNIIITKLC